MLLRELNYHKLQSVLTGIRHCPWCFTSVASSRGAHPSVYYVWVRVSSIPGEKHNDVGNPRGVPRVYTSRSPRWHIRHSSSLVYGQLREFVPPRVHTRIKLYEGTFSCAQIAQIDLRKAQEHELANTR